MRKYLLILTALLLNACVNQPHHLSAPTVITHNEKSYYLTSKQDLGSMARYFYTPKGETPERWQSAVELLLDRNAEQRSLADRIALRQRIYQNTGVEHFALSEQQNTLYAFVIYEPSMKNKDWQVDIAKGKDIPFCGFIQYQYSVKVEKNKKFMNMSPAKVLAYLKKYVAEKELSSLKQMEWNWGCRQ